MKTLVAVSLAAMLVLPLASSNAFAAGKGGPAAHATATAPALRAPSAERRGVRGFVARTARNAWSHKKTNLATVAALGALAVGEATGNALELEWYGSTGATLLLGGNLAVSSIKAAIPHPFARRSATPAAEPAPGK